MQMVNNRRIAKNTLLLYLRMGLIMLVSLWASRIVLHTLGDTDFGLYNVVAGIVVTFSFLSGVMNSSCNRYYAIALGKNDTTALHAVFKVNLSLFVALTLLIVLLAESAGLWLLEAKMLIPADRMAACRAVYQLSIISFAASTLAIPYRSVITAKEKMKVYAYCSVVEALLRLLVVFFLEKAPCDKLVFYAFLYMLVSVGSNAFYVFYCRHFYPECRFGKGPVDRELAKEVLHFNGWGIIGSLASIGKNQGLNILLNLFYGPAVNAARGVANQVYVNVYQFVQNYALAFNPQIVKSYSAGQHSDCRKLIYQSSKMAFFLLYIICLPLILEMDCVLDLWLVDVPAHSAAFARIMLTVSLIDSMYHSLYFLVQATGKVKWYNIAVGGCQLMIVLVSYIILKTSSTRPETVMLVLLIFSILAQIIRILMAKRLCGLPLGEYCRKVLLPVGCTALAGALPALLFTLFLPAGTSRLLGCIAISLLSNGLAVLFIGLDKNERSSLLKFVRGK